MALRDSDPAEVGGYRIEDRLGSGGMGVVYLARSASGRRLAIKVVHGQYADDDEFRARFRREVAAARRVSGAFTAPVVDAGADAPRPWMATLYIPGADLGTHVRSRGPLPPPRLRALAAGLAEALRDIHRAGVVHRDLKPANVMLAEDGPRVIDFGISRAAEAAASDALTQTGRVMGTPPFMSPEQFASPQDVGPAADIFSLGSVLTYAATGRGPFDSPSAYETALKVVEGEPDLTEVPEELLPCLRLCLDKDHRARPAADELFTLLREGATAFAGHPAPTTAATRPARPWPGTRPTEPSGPAWPEAARTERGMAPQSAPGEADAERPTRGRLDVPPAPRGAQAAPDTPAATGTPESPGAPEVSGGPPAARPAPSTDRTPTGPANLPAAWPERETDGTPTGPEDPSAAPPKPGTDHAPTGPEDLPAERPERGTGRTPTGPESPSAEPQAPAADRARRRRRNALMLAGAAVSVVLAALVTTTLTLTRDTGRTPSSSTVPADLPEGWRAWAAGPVPLKGAARLPGNSAFQRCAAVETSLVCAGGQVMAARYDLARGERTWTRFVDPTAPDGLSSAQGSIIGTDGDRVYAYQADSREMANGAGPLFTYTVAALSAETGKVLWRTRTADGQTARVPDAETGGAATVPEGVLTVHGATGDEYALLDAATGEVRWKRPEPPGAETCAPRAVGERPYLICTIGTWQQDTARTTVSELDAATGKARWTAEAKGDLELLGRDGDHLLLAAPHTPGKGLSLVHTRTHAVTAVPVSGRLADASAAHLLRGRVYFTRGSGGVSAVSPRTGRTLWNSNSTVERQGPPAASATHVYVASPSGRVAALNVRTGKVEGVRDGRDDGGEPDNATGAPPTLVGDALYVPYGTRSVHTLNVRAL
ncbi:PQQ-binding-like beta-propeller repeat protein [Streptomyces sp. NPDC001046]|uniref:protein kinase domain-containing protein n=1 Tax=Streptomyces sp. NPDC001046 TaxID=3364543 RepID=UPI0036AE1470